MSASTWWLCLFPSAAHHAPSGARMKLFTLDNRLIISKSGELAATDRRSDGAALREILP